VPDILRNVFQLHADNQTVLADEAYLGWQNMQGESVRSLCLPGYLGGKINMAGVKIINGNQANPARGLLRASGLTVVIDPLTGLILCIMEAAYLSALRTAGVTALAADLLLAPEAQVLSIIGTGVLAEMHIRLLTARFPKFRQVILYDIDLSRAEALSATLRPILKAETRLDLAKSAEEAVRQADFLVTCTTTTTGYIFLEWMRPGVLISHVSLDDVLPEVVLGADRLYVDDWGLVKADTRRLLGRLYREGVITDMDTPLETLGKRVDGTLGDLVAGRKVGRMRPADMILFNPFGCALADVGLAAQVYQEAQKRCVGTSLPR